jgi:phosphatidylglycerophosphatase A
MLVANFLGGWEIVLIIAVVLIVFGWKKFPDLFSGLGKGIKAFREASDEVTNELKSAAGGNADEPREGRKKFSLRLFVAQGFGVGWIPFAPGTFGSFLGLVWFVILVATGNFWAYLAGCIEGIAFSIWLCDDAEKILGQTDPGSVVLDEIIAIPFCFLPWVWSEWSQHGALSVSPFFTGSGLLMTLALVVLFRVFDIWKPWPVRQVQRLPGGWGVTVDDLLAAVDVALLSLFFVPGKW